ncbi:hypothetical protein CC85DRAFT_339519 [Cutaneotrichosporon oleaginosum]|uniref:Pkinase-domain-containing protein n=1 Tax=Cutaneotrichosporon oleaginosum TaxID=879819 RepID=A0A0J0XFR1_9TREE|nr:uncharacterized protein CC85DRAFT_339519 [Cutaneotrichosporon oleaginosum]KLT39908.1 hypothetical protein CC85DRAFT_339519 [Cutaneotrichosporon oleaginosum]TXT14199.1 hypothetical protein COLE_00392 [Cutaneotrichosporon oleaginosum]
MSVALSEESSNTTPTSAGFSSKYESATIATSSKRNELAASPASDSRRPSTPPLLRPPHGQTFVGHVKSWGDNQIADFLRLYRCDQYTLLFHRNDIDGKVLLDLDMSSLKEIGITKIGDRVKLLSGVRELRKRAARVPAPPPSQSRGLHSASAPADGSPLPLVQDTRGSQVPKRLATALVSKRLQLSRPPPLNLQRPAPASSPEGGLSLASPSSRAVTPRSHHLPNVYKTPGQGDSAAAKSSQESTASLRPPLARDHRRSPSPNFDDGGYAGLGRGDAQKHRPGVPRPADSPHRADQKAISPTQRSTREGNLPHPFASALRSDASKGGLDSQRGAYSRPTLPGSQAPSIDPSPRPGQPSLEDLRRHVVKFVNSEDGRTTKLDVSTCASGVEVLERVLKKFGKGNTGMSSFGPDNDNDSDRLEVDGWGVFIQSEGSEEGKCHTGLSRLTGTEVPLSESALLDICQGHRFFRTGTHNDPAVIRENGLVLRRVSHSVNRKNMDLFFGVSPPPRSPHSPLYYSAGVPRLGETWDQDSPGKMVASKKTNRASTVSIMSSLGVPGAVEVAPATDSARSSTIGTTSRKKMYNFFGHRPPSELISNHLADYFPSARKRDLEKTVRQSMMRLSQGHSQGLAVGAGHPAAASSTSLLSGQPGAYDASSLNRRPRPPSTRTVSSATTPAAIPEEVEMSNKASDPLAAAPADEQAAPVDPRPPLLPPFESTGESLVDSLQQYSPAPSTVRPALRQGRRGSSGSNLSRISVISSIRKSKDKSDTASLLTVDEITAEVENRRASMSTLSDPQEQDRPNTPAASDVFPSEDDTTDSSPSDTESDDSEATTDSEDHGHGRAFTSAGSRQIIKWIKGALIGAGSFGSVFLGMDAHSGLLMAVKQVDLPSGDARNEEKKRSTVQALEREIELLRELQHENIVQYLDSATDGNNLYIFLEYVPGGSVAALLSSYGAFEEALVRNFSRQILTGLNYLHERNIIHRDIKGANILVDNKGGIKISDFGISKKAESSR